jgi:hypothetical protein
VGYAAAGAAALAANLARRGPWREETHRSAWREGAGRWTGVVVGSGGIAVGVAGLLWHLESGFFRETTLRALVYSAPFAAPLAFAGLGFLALLGRLVSEDHPDWGRWVLFLAWGGFAGCLALALGDHAQNGFFAPAEWIAVAAGAVAVAFLAIPLVACVPRPYLGILLGVLALEAAVGVVGFVLHALPALRGAGAPLAERVLFGAPPFAPLLFADLALLGALGAASLRSA